jgi:hypothetical protein
MNTVANRPLLWQGALGGMIAGVIFAAFEMLASALMAGLAALFMPLRMISAIVLGAGVLDPATSLAGPIVVGLVVHLVLSAVFGMLFVIAAPAMIRATNGALGLVASASAFGFLLWIANFYVIAPLAGWTWFPVEANAVVQFLAHTFFYGSVLGFYLRSEASLAVTAGEHGRI